MSKAILIEAPSHFSFKHTVYSHGWSDLLPFELDEVDWVLSYVFTDPVGKSPTRANISADHGNIRVEIEDENISENFRKKLISEIRHILRLDDDLNGFYKITRKHRNLGWVGKVHAGRLVRSPTVFEDLVKTICTTNCSWGATQSMTKNLVEKLGVKCKSGGNSFPSAEVMANQSPDFYRQEIRAGYRSPYFVELSESVASGKIDPENWLNSELTTVELKKEMKSIKGVGDYAAENLLKLVGRYEGLALDSWLRARFYEKHNAGEVCDDKIIRRFYDEFGSWEGLAIWCDMTERWANLQE